MKRGSYGSPYRPPADGWFVPPRTYFGGLYQHQRPALNNLPRMVNNTQITLQPNQVGRPMTRGAVVSLSPGTCEQGLSNGLPNAPWIGPDANQGLPLVLGGVLTNTFQQNGTNSLGLATRLRGGKWVQAVRQWHGALGLLSHDAGRYADKYCVTETTDPNGHNPGDAGYIPTYQTTSFESPQPAADQTKYLSATFAGNARRWSTYSGNIVDDSAQASGTISVEAASGKVSSSISTTETILSTIGTAATVTTKYMHNGTGYTQNPDGTNYVAVLSKGSTNIDAMTAAVPRGESTVSVPYLWQGTGFDGSLSGVVGYWNANVDYNSALPPIRDPHNYSGSATYIAPSQTETVTVSWTRTPTSFVWSLQESITDNAGATLQTYTYTGSISLSSTNTASNVYGDITGLLGYWPLNDDALYPLRTDGIWQVAPLVSRDERVLDASPLGNGFIPATVDDLRAPIADQNGNAPWSSNANPPPPGWHYAPRNNDSSGRPPSDPDYGGPASWNNTYAQIAWFDDNAYGWQFPAGASAATSAAIALVRYGCTGLICGMPMPRAFTDANSYWYIAGYTPPANSTYENFFDYRAQIYHACEWFDEGGGGPYVDFYPYGYGEWLYDAITRTGAQLPHCATQWTNNAAAQTKPPYAYLIQADQQIYDWQGLQPGPSSDFTAYGASAIWAQKCMEIGELWPSQNFFGPAAANRTTPANLASGRYAPDETAVYCVSSWSGNTCYLATDPANIATGDLIGVNNNGNSGVYSCGVDHGSQSITLGTFHYPLPTGFALPSGDDGLCIWRIRFPAAPAILGRDAIATLTDAGAGQTQITLANPEPFLQTGDTIDLCVPHVTYNSAGIITGESMSVASGGQSVTRIDDSHFTVPVSLGGLTGAAYIVSSGAPAWYWDDTGRKGDFLAMQWLYDYRTNGEVSRLAGVTDCNNNTPPPGSPGPNSGYQATAALTAACTANNSLNWDGNAFVAAGQLVFKPCCYGVIAITPNGETWPNAVVIPFPATFLFDDRYGARWQAEIEQAMTDIYWQSPHSPCGLVSGTSWTMDDGTCHQDDDGTVQYYADAPMVEARVSVPAGAPALPSGVTIGYGNPVTYPAVAGALYPPGQIGYDPDSGNPAAAWTIWGYRLLLDGTCGGCRFDYVNMENLACVNVNYTPPAISAAPDDSTANGSTGSGLT